MRKSILAIPLLAALALAASHSETTTYVDGNLPGVTPNSGATLTVSDDNQMTLRTGLANVAVPFEKINHAELGAVKESTHDAPFYKFWAHHKPKNETQLLIVNFKNEAGEDKTMTLEMDQPAAASVFESIEAVTGKSVSAPTPAVATAEPEARPAEKAKPKTQAKSEKPDLMKSGKEPAQWWGDDWWKTTRNADKWTKPAPATTPDPHSSTPEQH
ncbi:MAG TPA: hypothetical protein VMG40_03240 [Bryobacteraceae bacterium]|nr:hypothetical protein [Bryobacteraceae bacterium]